MESTEKVTAVMNISSTDEERKLSTQVSDIEFRAESIVVNDDNSYAQAATFVKEVKRMIKSVKEFFKPMKDQAHRAHAEICKRENEMTEPLSNAEKILKESMGRFAEIQERKRREEAERQRLEAEKLAKQKLEEAITADEAGDDEGREIAMLDAAYAEQMAVNPTPVPSAPKTEGVSTKKDWEIVSIDDDKVPVDIAGICIRPVDKAAIMKLIRNSKGKVKIDGVTYRETVSISVRA